MKDTDPHPRSSPNSRGFRGSSTGSKWSTPHRLWDLHKAASNSPNPTCMDRLARRADRPLRNRDHRMDSLAHRLRRTCPTHKVHSGGLARSRSRPKYRERTFRSSSPRRVYIPSWCTDPRGTRRAQTPKQSRLAPSCSRLSLHLRTSKSREASSDLHNHLAAEPRPAARRSRRSAIVHERAQLRDCRSAV